MKDKLTATSTGNLSGKSSPTPVSRSSTSSTSPNQDIGYWSERDSVKPVSRSSTRRNVRESAREPVKPKNKPTVAPTGILTSKPAPAPALVNKSSTQDRGFDSAGETIKPEDLEDNISEKGSTKEVPRYNTKYIVDELHWVPMKTKLIRNPDDLKRQMSLICKDLNEARIHYHFHVGKPGMSLAEMYIDDIQRQVDDMRSQFKDLSKPHCNYKEIDSILDTEAMIIYSYDNIPEVIDAMIENQTRESQTWPRIYMACEGTDLLRNGLISRLLIAPSDGGSVDAVYVVNVKLLGKRAFETKSKRHSATLKTLLESKSVGLKVTMWDPRPANYALSLYGVKLGVVNDTQLLENATSFTTKALLDVKDAAATRLNLRKGELRTILETRLMVESAKKEGKDFFQHSKKVGDEEEGFFWVSTKNTSKQDLLRTGETRSAFDERRLHPELIGYCTTICCLLHSVFEKLCWGHQYLMEDFEEHYNEANVERLTAARSSGYKPHPASMNQPPPEWPNMKRINVKELAKQADDCKGGVTAGPTWASRMRFFFLGQYA